MGEQALSKSPRMGGFRGPAPSNLIAKYSASSIKMGEQALSKSLVFALRAHLSNGGFIPILDFGFSIGRVIRFLCKG
jgi:hypothetical protein